MSRKTLVLLIVALLAGTLVWGAGAGDLYEPGEQAVWVFEQDGQRVGTHVLRYIGSEQIGDRRVHHLRGSAHLQPAAGTPEQRYATELWIDDTGRPVKHDLQAVLGESYARVELTVDGTRGRARITQGPSEQETEVEIGDDTYLQVNNFIGYFEILFALHPPEKETTTTFRLFSSNSLRGLPYQTKWNREFAEERDGETVAGEVFDDSLGETIWISADGRLTRLEIKGAGLVVRRVDEVVELLEISAPESEVAKVGFESEEVEIVHGEVTLAGTITRPRKADGRLPAVFFISGSGSQDRNGMGSGVDTGTHEILDRLTEEGFLVLRVDDRGVGGSHGPTANMGYTDLVADARAAVDSLFKREDVDTGRVALIGHSEGGVTAPILAGERPEIAAVVLMAATGRPLIDVMMDQNADALTRAGVTGDALNSQLEEIRGYFDRITSEETLEASDLPVEFRTLLPMRKWLQDHARQEPLERVAALRCPVLIVQGGKDFQVSVDKDARALEAALKKAEHPDHVLHVFPDLDHLFKVTEAETSELKEYYNKRPVDTEFLDLLSDWLGERLLPLYYAEPRRSFTGD